MQTAIAEWRVIAPLLAISYLWSAPGHSQDAKLATTPRAAWSIPSNDAIRNLLAERMERNGVGIVVGVIEPAGRRVVAQGKTGARDARPLDGDTVFQIGSVTKVFTGLLLADMVLNGELKVDDPAAKYLPSRVRMPRTRKTYHLD